MRLLGASLLALLCAAHAHAADEIVLPYPYGKVEHKITAQAIAPPFDTAEVELLDYREVVHHERLGLWTIATAEPVVAVLLLYSGTSGFVVNAGLLVPTDHVVTLSAVLPESPGLLRLLVFDRAPEQKTLSAFATRPLTATSPHLLGQAWQRTLLRDTQRTRLQMPWEDTLDYYPRLSNTRSRWPFWLARIDSSYWVRTKDCSVSYSGLPTLRTTSRGSVGAWPLEIAETLRIRFSIPRGLSHRQAQLVLVGEPAATEFEVRVNGFTVPVLPDMSGGVPVLDRIDIRGFLRGGANELELRAPTFGQGGRLLRAELWLE
jgi:hypothetical protein